MPDCLYYHIALHSPGQALGIVTETVQEAAVIAADWVERVRREGLAPPGQHWATITPVVMAQTAWEQMIDLQDMPFEAPMHRKWAAQEARKADNAKTDSV